MVCAEDLWGVQGTIGGGVGAGKEKQDDAERRECRKRESVRVSRQLRDGRRRGAGISGEERGIPREECPRRETIW